MPDVAVALCLIFLIGCLALSLLLWAVDDDGLKVLRRK